jgi:hypothetical protein
MSKKEKEMELVLSDEELEIIFYKKERKTHSSERGWVVH